ncbi:MAG TPA: helicase, partial [Hyphomicrobium sp.]
QFCHVIVNFDMPWNPMRVEQRIGRVDRIGQPHIVRAMNFVLEDTVEHRVREVLETKLAIIAEEFGVDKAADVMDSVEAEPLFDELFVQGLQNPDAIEAKCETIVSQLRSTISESRKSNEFLADGHDLDADAARKWRDHPAQFWLERAITTGLPARGGKAVKEGDAWRVKWPDGSESTKVCFDARTAEDRPDIEWVTLEDPRARSVISDLPRCVSRQPLPTVRITGLPESVQGIWSLWEISLSADDISRRRFLSVFVNDEGRVFLPTAKRIWDLLLTERIDRIGAVIADDADGRFDRSRNAAITQGERIFTDLVEEHRTRIQEERARAKYAYDARYQAIGRIGLQTVRDYRRKRLLTDHDARMAQLDAAEAYTPDLNAILMLRVGEPSIGAS